MEKKIRDEKIQQQSKEGQSVSDLAKALVVSERTIQRAIKR